MQLKTCLITKIIPEEKYAEIKRLLCLSRLRLLVNELLFDTGNCSWSYLKHNLIYCLCGKSLLFIMKIKKVMLTDIKIFIYV